MAVREAKGGKRLIRRKKKHRLWPLFTFMAVYAVLFGTAAACGLYKLWGYLDAYERSRSGPPVAEYMDALTREHICDSSIDAVLELVDGRVQDEETCRAILMEALEGKLSYAKNISKTTDVLQVYGVRCGDKTVGSFWMERTGEDQLGIELWEVTGDAFDMTYLMTAPVGATVPEDHTVLVNGTPLPPECVVESDIPYEGMEEFSDEYRMPCMVRYEAGPFLGEAELTIQDADGQPVEGEIDPARVLDNCTDEEKAAIEELVGGFVEAYVAFSANVTGSPRTGLNRLNNYLVPGTRFAGRMKNALDSLSWVQAHSAVVLSVDYGQRTKIADDLYICEVLYSVKTKGTVMDTHLKLLLRRTDSGLLVEDIATL